MMFHDRCLTEEGRRLITVLPMPDPNTGFASSPLGGEGWSLDILGRYVIYFLDILKSFWYHFLNLTEGGYHGRSNHQGHHA